MIVESAQSPPDATAGSGDMSRIVIAGKGGVGKTTLTALLARFLARQGMTVLAVDADAQMNLGYALGLPPAEAAAIVPLSDNPDYVEEKTGARPGAGWTLMLRLNPDAGDAVERFSVPGPDGVQLIVMGSLHQAAAGCLCPENTLLGAVIAAIALRPGELILMDTQAGVEHFGRALARGFGQAVVVTDPSFNGLSIAVRTASLARQLGIPHVHLVVNRVRGRADLERLDRHLDRIGGEPFASRHVLPHDDRVLESEPAIDALLEASWSPFTTAVMGLGDALTRIARRVP